MEIIKRILKYETGYYDANKNFIRHNENGPAYQEYAAGMIQRYELYYNNGKLHRLDGPASIIYKNDKLDSESFFIFGNQICAKDFYTPGFVASLVLEQS